jgi:FAD/FMN-containing dehydrogenase
VVVLVNIIPSLRPKISNTDFEFLGDVGVGGLTLGGGLSFLSAEYGLVCDNVVNYEVVLANASIVNANASSNSDLYWALKGGGNQFGASL